MYTDNNGSSCINYCGSILQSVQPQENNVQVFVLDCMLISLTNTPGVPIILDQKYMQNAKLCIHFERSIT